MLSSAGIAMIEGHMRKLTTYQSLMAFGVAVIIVAYVPSPSAVGTVTIVGVARNHSSVRITYNPVAGAKDYRVYDVTNPSSVKYAGLNHLSPSTNCPGTYCQNHFVTLADGVTPVVPYQVANGPSGGPQVIDAPALQIDWNNVGDSAPHTVIVEAVDQLGPAPLANMSSGPITHGW